MTRRPHFAYGYGQRGSFPGQSYGLRHLGRGVAPSPISLGSGAATVPASSGTAPRPGTTQPLPRGVKPTPGKMPSHGNIAHMFASRIGARDTVPAMLEPGEAVLNVGAAKLVGKGAINKLNARGRKVMGFQGGGIVPGPGNIGYVGTEEQDPRWADISLRAPGINIGQLKQKAAASGISPEAIRGIMSLFQKGASGVYTGGGRGGSSVGDTEEPEAWWANAQGYQGGTGDVEFPGASDFHPMRTWYDYRYGAGGNPNLYGGPGRGETTVDIGNVQPADIPVAMESPTEAAPVDIGNAISGSEDYPSGRGQVPTSQYSGGRGLISSTAPPNSGNFLTRLLGNLRGQFPTNLGGMTDPTQATQNAAYWSAINGPGLSNPSFYPGGGSAPGTSGLNTPGGVPFDPSGSDLSMLPSGFTHGAGPLTPNQYNYFQYSGGINKPNYASYLAQYPQAIQAGPLLGGSAGRVPVSAR